MSPETLLFIASLATPALMLIAGIALCLVRTHRVGGLVFWRIGRLGGSLYIARESKCPITESSLA